MRSPKQQLYVLIKERQDGIATNTPVDSMGGFIISQANLKGNKESVEKQTRFHCFVKLLLSPQTKDQITHSTYLTLTQELEELAPEIILKTDSNVLEELIKPCGYFRTKTKNLIQSCNIMVSKYNGDLPQTLGELLGLPGVGKKIAILAMRICWNKVVGISVDTHVHKISNRLGWVTTKSPEQTRVALENIFDIEDWEYVNWALVGYGQAICKTISPSCSICKLKQDCKYYNNIRHS